jgi:hypothetical protein
MTYFSHDKAPLKKAAGKLEARAEGGKFRKCGKGEVDNN